MIYALPVRPTLPTSWLAQRSHDREEEEQPDHYGTGMGTSGGEPAAPPGDEDEQGHADDERDGEGHADGPDDVHEEALEITEDFHGSTLANAS